MSIAPAPDLCVEEYLPRAGAVTEKQCDGLRLQTPSSAMADDEIHIWVLPRHDVSTTAGRNQYDQWWTLLPGDERERAKRFHFAHHTTDFVANRARLRLVLGNYLGQQPDQIRFAYSALGKPALASDHTALSFNLSHTDGLAVIAITKEGPIGVDVETTGTAGQSFHDSMDIARDYFSPTEMKDLEGYKNPVEQRIAFLRCWTRKEAFLKAIGDGLARPLSGFSVSCGTDTAALLDCSWDSAAAEHWNLFSLDVAEGYIAAVCYQGATFRLPRTLKRFNWSHTL